MTSPSSVSWYALDVIRNGSLGVLIEREHQSWLNRPVYLDASWTALNGTPVSNIVAGSLSGGGAPDGTTAAQIGLGNTTTSQINQTIGGATIPDSTIVTVSALLKGDVGGEQVKLRVVNKAAANTDLDTTLTTSWAQYVVAAVDASTGGSVITRLMNRTAVAMNFDGFGYYMNTGRYPLAVRRATTQGPTWQPDVLTFLSAQIPAALRTGKVAIAATPQWAPADLQSGDQRWLLSIGTGGTEGYRVRHTGTDVRVEVVIAGSVVASSPAVTGSTRLVRRTFTFDPVAATVSIDGVAGSAGTPWSLTSGVQVRVGGVLGGASEFDGYIEQPVVA